MKPSPDNGFFVGIDLGRLWNLFRTASWATNWTEGCSSFVLVRFCTVLPTTTATVIVNDPEEGWFIDGEYRFQEHEVGEDFLKAMWYLGIEGVLEEWLHTLEFKNTIEPVPNGFEIYSVEELIEDPYRHTRGLFYILPDKAVCDRCAAAPGIITEEMFANGDVSACWSHDPWDHQECGHCGVVFDAGDRVYHPQPHYAGE